MSAELPSSEKLAAASKPELNEDEKNTILQAACQRVIAAVRRDAADPTRVMLGAKVADAPVYGAFVTLRREGQLRSCCGYIGESMRLGDALDRAADRAATDDPRFPPISRGEIGRLDVDVWVLWGPEVVAAKGEDRVKAVTIGRHGVQIARGAARGLLLPGVAIEHHFDARTFLQQVCVKAGLPTDAWLHDDTTLMVFDGLAIAGPLMSNDAGIRQAAVAGAFYPGDAEEMRQELDAMFAAVMPKPTPEPWAGALVPHAGWMYSGQLAASVFSRIIIPPDVIMFCPKHRAQGARWAVAPHGRWLIPGGHVAANPDLAFRLAGSIDGLELDAAAHRQEHAIEVELPFLAHLAPKVRVTGVVVGESSLAELLRFGDALAGVIQHMQPRPLLVISSDMNHFADDVKTRRLDRLAMDAIATLDPEHIYATVQQHGISMCGVAACVVVLAALHRLDNLHRCETVSYATSADAKGPADRVVGYAGMLFQ
jgi:AmmeMemoRadiSam system protein B/AmmeMemoRadiSam system protein A